MMFFFGEALMVCFILAKLVASLICCSARYLFVTEVLLRRSAPLSDKWFHIGSLWVLLEKMMTDEEDVFAVFTTELKQKKIS
jgi:hypothetical protein